MQEDREYGTISIDKLLDNPHQHLVGDVSAAEIAELAASMDRDGQRTPVDILPDGTILDGHQRTRAARTLGWEHLNVCVRHDLAGMSDLDQQDYIIRASLERRQLGPIGIGRAAQELIRIEREQPEYRRRHGDKGDIRDRIAARLAGLSGRQVERYIRLLELPRVIQDAIERKDIHMSDGFKLLKLPRDERQTVFSQIDSGVPVAEAVSAALATRAERPKPSKPAAAVGKLLKFLKTHIDDLETGAAEAASSSRPPSSLKLLGRVQKVIAGMLNVEREASQ